jgi:flagellar motor switch protein FliM
MGDSMTSSASKFDQMISNLLSAAEKQPVSASEEPETVDYDWDSPSSFTLSELENLETFTAQAGIEIAKALSGQIHEEVELQADKPQQYYAEKLPLLQSETANYCISFSTGGSKICGLIAIPGHKTIEWVAKVLGGSAGDSEQERELSSMEAALLQDILNAVTKAFSNAFSQAGGKTLTPGTEISPKAELPEANPSDEYTLLSFRISPDEKQPAISIVLACDVLAGAAGAGNAAGAGKDGQDNESPENIRKKMLATVEQAYVEGYVNLGTANLTIREVMGLEEGDVMLIHKTIDEPAEFIVHGKTVLSGYPSRCEGQYALSIAKPGKRKKTLK